MPCTHDATPEEIRASVEATQRREQEIRNTISNLARMLCTMCKGAINFGIILPDDISQWYEGHQERDKARLAKARATALAKLDDDEKEALGL
jgi:hypothetical protein